MSLKKIIESRTVFVILILMVVLLGYALGKIVYSQSQNNTELKKDQQRAEELRSQQSRLQGLLGYLQTDYFAEREARVKLGLQKPGEHLVVVPADGTTGLDPTQDNSIGSPRTQSASTQDSLIGKHDAEVVSSRPVMVSNPKLWWEYFFKN